MVSLPKVTSSQHKKQRGRQASFRWRVQFVFNGKSHTVRLGQRSKTEAEVVSANIDLLLRYRKNGQPLSPELQAWLEKEALLAEKLSKTGLCKAVENPSIKYAVDNFLKNKVCKPNTQKSLDQALRHLIEYFGKDTRLKDVGPQKALAFTEWLYSRPGLSVNTVRRRVGRCREFFNHALEQQLIAKNPFKIRSITVTVGAARKEYVEASTVAAIIDYLPSDRSEWRLLFAFSRFFGLRIPSEIRELSWDAINVERGSIIIKSPKTEVHGKAERSVPIFLAVSELIEQHREVVGHQEFLFPKLRRHTNLGTTAKKFVEKAGIAPWSEFWNALRASCETDLMDIYGVRRACMWIGNTPQIAFKNYSLMRKTDFADEGEQKSDLKSDYFRLNYGDSGHLKNSKSPVNSTIAASLVAPAGIEPTAKL